MITAFIKRKERKTPTVETIYFKWDSGILPGQFVMIWVPGVGEIPMSISHIGREKAFTVKNYGPTSAAIQALSPGDRIFFRGPYGRPFQTVSGRILLIGGGSGMASLHPLINNSSFGLVAARSKEEILFADEFTDENLIITTDDGSEGIKGNVIEGLKKIDLKKFDMIYACGPEVMLYNAYLYFRKIGVNAQLSLERTMKCGVGICDSCSIGGFQLCRDGPVFFVNELEEMQEFGNFKLTYSGKRVHI